MTKLRFTKKFEIELDSNKLKWFYMSCAAALPQLDRGSDYESERHRDDSLQPQATPSQSSSSERSKILSSEEKSWIIRVFFIVRLRR